MKVPCRGAGQDRTGTGTGTGTKTETGVQTHVSSKQTNKIDINKK